MYVYCYSIASKLSTNRCVLRCHVYLQYCVLFYSCVHNTWLNPYRYWWHPLCCVVALCFCDLCSTALNAPDGLVCLCYSMIWMNQSIAYWSKMVLHWSFQIFFMTQVCIRIFFLILVCFFLQKILIFILVHTPSKERMATKLILSEHVPKSRKIQKTVCFIFSYILSIIKLRTTLNKPFL